jgi:hypothetical protein
MATRDLIKDIVEAFQATIRDPTNKEEANEAVGTAAIAACYALGETLDDLIQRVEKLEVSGAVPVDLGSELESIRQELLTLEQAVQASAMKKDAKKKGKNGKKGKQEKKDKNNLLE